MVQQTTYGATGRRKEAVASVRLMPGKGAIVINGKDVSSYLNRETLVITVKSPLHVTETAGRFDIDAMSNGGGKSGQAGALRLAISRALVKLNPDFKDVLRDNGFLTRDPRAVERKKYGRPKARKRFQYSKR